MKLTAAAESSIGADLPDFQRAVRQVSFLDKIAFVDAAVDLMVQETLILPDERYALCRGSIAAKKRAIRDLFGSPTVPDETKASISLILAVYNLHLFGVYARGPRELLEIVRPQEGASAPAV